ncbi:MAG: hypothetical protein K8823_205 [Cenarchaeum symbiont of Oopsacas minuta]|nr:hypothetical protein [Cenarchaeum symbiont of Oopsacas minuta]
MSMVYLISAVSYNSDHKIHLLRQHKDVGGAIEEGELVERSKVASNIRKGMIYHTIRKGSKSWIIGQRITVKKVQSDYCVRTDNNRVIYDNLGDIAELEKESK